MAPAERTFSAQKGEEVNHELVIGLSNLMPGYYRMSILITNSEQASACDFEWIDRAISFEIIARGGSHVESTWSQSAFGSIKLPIDFVEA